MAVARLRIHYNIVFPAVYSEMGTVLETWFNLLKPIGYLMHQQFKIQQLYALPTLYLFSIYLRTNSDLCHLQHKLIGFLIEMISVYCAVRTGSLN
jgi:hypothetical protein